SIFLSLFFFPALATAHSVNLSWDASTSQQVIGYNVYRGTNPNGPYTQINSSLDPNTSYTDSTVQSGQTYYYVTTAVNSDNTQSEYSNQTEAQIPGGGSGSENALYNFAGGSDPKLPYAGLVFDKAGNLYGTTELGGANNQGTVFEIIRNANGTWTETVLYNFIGSADGGQPYGSLVFDAAGNLYGTTNFGGSANCNLGCGTVFKLTPGSSGWSETVLYSFGGGSDGREPSARVVFDAAGNLYVTTLQGGNISSVCSSGCGTVFKLTAGSSGWTESVLHAFSGGYDGKYPYGDLIFDAAGNLYGTAFQGGAGYGVVYELSRNSNGAWHERVLHGFVNMPAGNPVAGLVMDSGGNLYGTTMLGESESSCGGGCGVLFKLSPVSGGPWSYKVVHVFGQGTDGFHPTGDLILDSASNLYGTTQAGGAEGSGLIFQIMH